MFVRKTPVGIAIIVAVKPIRTVSSMIKDQSWFFVNPSVRNIPISLCFSIWISLPSYAKILGSIWFVIGFAYLVIKTRGFIEKPVMFDFKNI